MPYLSPQICTQASAVHSRVCVRFNVPAVTIAPLVKLNYLGTLLPNRRALTRARRGRGRGAKW